MFFHLVFFLLFPIWSILFSLVGSPLALFSKDFALFWMKIWARSSLWLLYFFAKIDVRYIGSIPPSGSIIASEHQSVLEILALVSIIKDPIFILKKNLMWIPFLNIFLIRLNMIPVDRSRVNIRWFEKAKNALAAGKTLIIFPEGTRVAYGQIKPYKSGVFKLAEKLQMKIIPVAIDCGKFWPRRNFVKYPGTTTIVFGEPIEPDRDLLRVTYRKLLEFKD